jgi:hypothetical protein
MSKEREKFDSTVYLVLALLTKEGISCQVIQREAKRRPTTYATDNGRVVKIANLGKFDSHTLSTSPSCYAYTDDAATVGPLVESAKARMRKAANDLFSRYFDLLEGSKKAASVSFSRTERD